MIIVIILIYTMTIVSVYLLTKKRLLKLNKRHIKHTQIELLNKDCEKVGFQIFILFVILYILTIGIIIFFNL